MNCVRVSVSLPENLWAFARDHSRKSGHEMISRTVQRALRDLMEQENGGSVKTNRRARK